MTSNSTFLAQEKMFLALAKGKQHQCLIVEQLSHMETIRHQRCEFKSQLCALFDIFLGRNH